MKINWGTAVVIAFVLFMTFILYFVFKVQGNAKYDNEMVVEEYYKKDARYSEEMEKVENTARLDQKPTITIAEEGIQITFPKQFNTENIIGEVSFYRPSAKKLDFTIPIHLSGGSTFISKKDLAGGRWGITLSWKLEGKEYMMKKEIYLN